MADPLDSEAAREHIDLIRKSNGICEAGKSVIPTKFAQIVDATFNHLANDLYSQENHFLYEILQNADDAKYPEDVRPRICLTIYRAKPQRLELTCNEKGFSHKDVESICDAYHSSKTLNPYTIGEKGIGFKSVFKVASKVQIRSNYYSFKFDTTAKATLSHLSMITPIWVPYDTTCADENRYEGTLMKLFFKRDFDISTLESELMTFDFAFLLFCRTICNIKIKVFSEDGHLTHWREGRQRGNSIFEIQVAQGNVSNDEIISEAEDVPETENEEATSENDAEETNEDESGGDDVMSESIESIVEDKMDSPTNSWRRRKLTSTKYLTYSYLVKAMPETARRETVTDTTILLAFPFNSRGIILQNQPTFAFLPIRLYGLTFILHADFVLTANREDIDKSLPWNIHLRNKIGSAFVEACLNLSQRPKTPDKDPDFRILWPQYVACLDAKSTAPFFGSVWQPVHLALSRTLIVITDEGHRELPSRCCIVSPLYRYADGRPLLDSEFTEMAAVSPEYPEKSLRGLRLIGVKDLNAEEFVSAFNRFARLGGGKRLQHMPSEWHQRVSEALLTALAKIQKSKPRSRTYYPRFLELLKHYPIVPLRDESWTSIESGGVFFDGTTASGSLNTPEGIAIKIVHGSASSVDCRRKLLVELGVRNCDDDQICRLILQLHSPERPPSFKPAIWISHATFLFENGYSACNLGDRPRLWLVDHKDNPDRHGPIYLPFGELGSIFRRYFSESCQSISLLHLGYQNAVRQQRREEWYYWLLQCYQVRPLPLLHKNGVLSAEARYVFSKEGSQLFLAFMKDSGIIFEQLPPTHLTTLKEEMSSLRVSTHKGSQTHLLRECALPRLSRNGDPFLHPLDLEKPEDAYWTKLHIFGVVTEVGLQYHLRHLLHLNCQAGPRGEVYSPIHRVVAKIYTDIEKCVSGHEVEEEEARNVIERNDLVFVDHAVGGRHWAAPSDCVWKADFDCSDHSVLSTEYKKQKTFFRDLLHIQDAGLDTFIAELEYLERNLESTLYSVASAQKNLMALDKLLRKPSPSDDQIASLKSLPCIPVWRGGTITDPKETKVISPSDLFYIPDRGVLYKVFEGLTWLPYFADHKEIFGKLRNVIHHLGLRDKLLSVAVREVRVDVEGTVELDSKTMERLVDKIPYILHILRDLNFPSDGPCSVADWERRLKATRIFRAEQVTLHREIRVETYGHSGLEIRGRGDSSKVAISDPSGDIKIFLPRNDSNISPFSPCFIEKLSDHLGLKDDAKTRLAFTGVLTSIDGEEAQDALEKQGISCVGYNHEPSKANHDDSDTDDDEHDCQDHSISGWKTSIKDREASPAFTYGLELRTPRRNGIKSYNSPKLVSDQDDEDDDQSRYPPSKRRLYPATEPGTPIICAGTRVVVSDEELEDAMESCTLLDTTPTATYEAFKWSETRARKRLTQASDMEDNMSTPSSSSDDLLDEVDRGFKAMSFDSQPQQPGSVLASSDNRQYGGGLLTPSPRRALGASPGTSTSVRKLSTSGGFDTNPWAYRIGLYGELFTFKFLKDLLHGEGFNEDYWTSNYRSRVFPGNKFLGKERDHSDFTYTEADGAFGSYLFERGLLPDTPALTTTATTYHIEVKASTEGLSSAFKMSANQINMARKYSTSDTDVYLIVRVYDLRLGGTFTGKMRIFLDPWSMICDGKLVLGGQDRIDLSPVGL